VDAGGNLYVSDRDNWRVQKLTADGTFVDQWRLCLDAPACQFPDAGSGPGEFFAARGLTVDGQGNLYVADTANKRVQRLIAFPVPVPLSEAEGS
jgi:sugar lactone lactonase YvrE